MLFVECPFAIEANTGAADACDAGVGWLVAKPLPRTTAADGRDAWVGWPVRNSISRKCVYESTGQTRPDHLCRLLRCDRANQPNPSTEGAVPLACHRATYCSPSMPACFCAAIKPRSPIDSRACNMSMRYASLRPDRDRAIQTKHHEHQLRLTLHDGSPKPEHQLCELTRRLQIQAGAHRKNKMPESIGQQRLLPCAKQPLAARVDKNSRIN